MKKFVILGMAIFIAACSSSSAPKKIYSGTWKGLVQVDSNSISITTTTSQSGSAINGTCTAVSTSGSSSNNFTCTLAGTSNAPAVGFTMDFNDSEVIIFSGQYISADSVAGILTENGDTISGFGFKKQ